jgi:hypothetical protein
MRLERKGSNVAISGSVSSPQNFNISSSRIAFNILSSGLYNDKVRAIIRELSCNAWDAHVMAGKRDVPFEIHLPTTFEPFFSIKDYGTGLNYKAKYVYRVEKDSYTGHSREVCLGLQKEGQKLPADARIKEEDEVVHLYCTYFASDKNDNDELIGAMGLGSKSPFCYCEGFTIINRYEGVTRIYSAFISEQGTPAVVLQDETATPDAPNGLEITFPVKIDDCWEFENKAKLALEFFQPRPIINIDLEIPKQTYALRTDNWGMREGNRISGLRAIQGNVQYMVGNIDISRMTPDQQKITQMPLDIFFPIGQLSVAASREALQLDERTVNNILNMLDEIYQNMLTEVKHKIDTCGSIWEARLLIFSLIQAPGIGGLVNEADRRGDLLGTYKNFNLSQGKAVINELDALNATVFTFTRGYRSSLWARKESLFHKELKHGEILDAIAQGRNKREAYDIVIDVDPQMGFVINDVKKGCEKYIHYFLQEATDNCEEFNERGEKTKTRIKGVYFFTRAHKDVPVATAVAEAKATLASLGNPKYILVSELQQRYGAILDARKPKVDPSAVRDILELKNHIVSCYSQDSIKGWSRMWTKSESQPVGKKFYIPVENLAPTESGFMNAEQLTEFIQSVRKAGIFGIDEKTVIYGLKVGSKLRKDKNWVDVIKYIFDRIPKVVTPQKEAKLSLLLKEFDCDFDDVLSHIANHLSLTADSPMQIFCNDLKKAKQPDREQSKALTEVLSVAERRNLYTPKNTIDFSARYKAEVLPVYPMLNLVSCSYDWKRSIKQRQIMIEYFRTVDLKNAEAQQNNQSTTVAVGN